MARAFEEQVALFGQLHAARGTRQQRGGQLVLQPRQRAADAGRGLPEVHRSGAQRAAIDDGDEGL
jgi:hypothetical protein